MNLDPILARVVALAAQYEATAAELPLPHGPVTEAFLTAARDIRAAISESELAQ